MQSHSLRLGQTFPCANVRPTLHIQIIWDHYDYNSKTPRGKKKNNNNKLGQFNFSEKIHFSSEKLNGFDNPNVGNGSNRKLNKAMMHRLN